MNRHFYTLFLLSCIFHLGGVASAQDSKWSVQVPRSNQELTITPVEFDKNSGDIVLTIASSVDEQVCEIENIELSTKQAKQDISDELQNCGLELEGNISIYFYEAPNWQSLKDRYAWNKLNPFAKHRVPVRRYTLFMHLESTNGAFQEAANPVFVKELWADYIWMTSSQLNK